MKYKFIGDFNMKIKNIITVSFLLLVAVSFSSCTEKVLSEEQQILSNLLKNGSVDAALLVGEWDIVWLAYTADGKTVSHTIPLSRGRLSIPFAPTPTEYTNWLDSRWRLGVGNSIWWSTCSLSGGSIKLTFERTTLILPPEDVKREEGMLTSALLNAYSFVTNGNELIFRLAVDSEDHNLLILKRREV